MKVLHTLLFLCFSIPLLCQPEDIFPPLSARGTIHQAVGNTNIAVEYERPSVRKRKILGGLVPYNEVWRTGAGPCTKIGFDKAVRIGNQYVEAGVYSLFTIPDPEHWTVILNSDTTLYGSGRYDVSNDVARFIAIPEESNRFFETLTIDIDIIPNNARIYLSWGNTRISFDLVTSTDRLVNDFIEAELSTGRSDDPEMYARAAEYLLYQKQDLLKGLQFARRSGELDPEMGWSDNVEVHLLWELRMYDEAMAVLNDRIISIQNASYESEEIRKQDIEWWEAIKSRIEDEMQSVDKH